MSLPLSKYYDPEKDLPELVEELVVVDEHFTKDSPQSEHRRWEYAMALRAFDTWGRRVDRVVDVGGAGSPFWRMVSTDNVYVIDPLENESLELHLQMNPPLADAVFCLSVLEHVDDLDQFLYHLSCLVAPGGLLFLTLDCCGCGLHQPRALPSHQPEADPHHFNSMRKRIFTPEGLLYVWDRLEMTYHFMLLGGPGEKSDFDHYAPRLYGGATDPGYSFASLALVKRA